jgi:hypothetical protein
MNLFASGATLLLASSMSLAQLSFENPRKLNVPEDKARLLFQMSCRAVADELHLRESSAPHFEMRLVLDEQDEHFGYDEHTGVPTLFLHRWNEQKFVTAVVRFAVEWSVSLRQQQRIIANVLHRSDQDAPVSVEQLHKFRAPGKDLSFEGKDNCLTRITDASARDVECNFSAKKSR